MVRAAVLESSLSRIIFKPVFFSCLRFILFWLPQMPSNYESRLEQRKRWGKSGTVPIGDSHLGRKVIMVSTGFNTLRTTNTLTVCSLQHPLKSTHSGHIYSAGKDLGRTQNYKTCLLAVLRESSGFSC